MSVVQLLQEAVPGETTEIADDAWAERATREVAAETDRLEGELKGYKNNLIKESIRV